MRLKAPFSGACALLAGLFLTASAVSGQTAAYRQTNLTSNAASAANNITTGLVNPWGAAFFSAQPFFIANNKSGSVIAHNAAGSSLGLPAFTLPNADNNGLNSPTGIVADPNAAFAGRSLTKPFLIVTADGNIFQAAPNAQGVFPLAATLALNNSSSGAVYTGVALLSSQLTQQVLAIADFHRAFIDTFLPGFTPVAIPGPFKDRDLPPGFAPFNIQVVGNQVFVTYALQDAAQHDPVFGAGNGLVDIYDMDGNFLRRFATGGTLNAPWGVTQASASFGPFSNDILIGNAGDGTITAFDANGNFIGQIKDGDGNLIVNPGLHALTFRPDGFGDPNTLFFTAGVGNGRGGLFGAITSGLVSISRVAVPDTPADSQVTITVNVGAAIGNPGTPTGSVSIKDAGVLLSSPALVNGAASFTTSFTDAGRHPIQVQYNGDATFLPSFSETDLHVTGPATTLTLSANATAGAPVQLMATIRSAGGTPTGQIVFHDGANNLGTVALNAAGTATLAVNNFSAGAHTVTADYAGDGTFAASTSNALTITIGSPDFALGANPLTATVTAGQSTQFQLAITPANGFSGNVTFSCAPVAGITCSFNPANVTPANGTATTMLTVSTSASVSRYGILPIELAGPASLLAAITLFGLVIIRRAENFRSLRPALITAAAILALSGVSFIAGGCGYGGATRANRGTAMVTVNATSGAVTHSTNIAVTVQ